MKKLFANRWSMVLAALFASIADLWTLTLPGDKSFGLGFILTLVFAALVGLYTTKAAGEPKK